jgi:hypothetical protein
VADGAMIFSKYEQDRFPTHDEIVRALRERGAGAPERGAAAPKRGA